jgi:hypothetical protein
MFDTWNRAERYRDLAEECRRLAAIGSSINISTEIQNRYLRMAEHYSALAEAEKLRIAPRAKRDEPSRMFQT